MTQPSNSSPASQPSPFHEDIIYPSAVPFILVHLACLAAFWTGVTWSALTLCVVLYFVRMFGISAGHHRYFSHRSFRTSRVFQFVLALLGQASAQRGVLWWAAKHRHHHKYSDTELDVHSPRQRGFWYSHVGWIFAAQHDETDYTTIPDLAQYPELVWLNEHRHVPAAALAVGCLLVGGWTWLVVGFFWSTVLLFHGTFFINSLAHVHGKKRYVTGDDSRNNWWLALITMGEGWHNNHHAYQRSTRQGFRWYEVDPSFYVLKMLSWVGIVWDFGVPPPDVVRNERRLGRAVVERVAQQLAGSFQSRGLHMPHLPTVEQIRARARAMFAESPSMDDIVARARELILHTSSGNPTPT